ncbi:MAG: glycosyltransferase [Candidatus Micrarchaeaceae archaeon]
MSDSLRIAFYTDSFLPAVDGVVVSILNFRKELEKRGHEVYIFASGTDKTKSMTKGDKRVVVVRGLKFKKYPQYSLALFPLTSKISTFNIKMDINHAQTPFMMGVHSLLISKVERTPIIGSFHTLFTDRNVIRDYAIDSKFLASKVVKYSWKYARLFYNRCDGVTVPSSTMKGMLDRKGIKNVCVVPNGIDTSKFNESVDGSAVRRKLVRKRGEKLVMYVGRLSKEKRIETLIKAAKLLRDENIRFAIVGSGPAHAHYEDMVKRMHLDKVVFTGFVENRHLPKYYSACDLFCIPSMFETQGVVSLEAMACGKPVVGANYLALKELISNGRNGEKFRPLDSGDCARKIKKVIYNIDSYKGMADTAKRYSIERATDDLLNLYGRVLNNESS